MTGGHREAARTRHHAGDKTLQKLAACVLHRHLIALIHLMQKRRVAQSGQYPYNNQSIVKILISG
jgi:hypothetical protein